MKKINQKFFSTINSGKLIKKNCSGREGLEKNCVLEQRTKSQINLGGSNYFVVCYEFS